MEKKGSLSDQEREGLFNLFGQCRFGFQEALNASGDNEQARDGLQNTFELMIRYEIEQKSVHAAEMLLAQLPSSNEELQRQLERLKRILAEKEQEIARLQKLHYDKDQTVGAGTRFYFALLFGGGWGLINVFKGYIERNSPQVWQHYSCMTVDLGVLILIPVATYLFRKLLLQNQASRRYVWLAVLLVFAMLVQSSLAYLTDISLRQNTFQQIMLATAFTSVLAVTLDRRMAIIAGCCAVALVVGIVAPPYVYDALGAASFVSFAFLAYLWRQIQATSTSSVL